MAAQLRKGEEEGIEGQCAAAGHRRVLCPQLLAFGLPCAQHEDPRMSDADILWYRWAWWHMSWAEQAPSPPLPAHLCVCWTLFAAPLPHASDHPRSTLS